MNIVYVSHGGGPLPLLGDPDHAELIQSLQALAGSLPKPAAILLISAHWEATVATVTSGKNPGLIYDYAGFPEAAYRVQYSCQGSPLLAQRIQAAILSAGLQAKTDEQRGFDHGMFVPLKIMYPKGDIPCVQLSLLDSLDGEQHLALGRALQHIEWKDLLVIGSGASFHNINAFFAGDANLNTNNRQFMASLRDTLCNGSLSETERWQKLARWKTLPYADYCHPREEHLLPLHVCYGLAGRACDKYDEITISNCKSALFKWT